MSERQADRRRRGDNALVALLRIPVFRRLWAAITISSLGDWLGLLANTALAQQLTRTESLATQGVAISGVILTRLLPDLLLGPVAGALADKLDRRKTVVIGETLAGLLYLSIAIGYQLTWLYIAQFLIEAVGLFTMPAKQAIWVNVVPRERLSVANQMSLLSVYGSVPIAALLFALLSTLSRFFQSPSALPGHGDVRLAILIALAFNSVSFFVSAGTVYLLRRQIPAYTSERSKSKNVFSLIAEGVSFLRSHRLMRALYVGIIGAFGAGGLTVGVAQLYVATLQAGTAGYSILFGAVFTGLAVGMLLGPRILPTVARRRIFAAAIGLAGLVLIVMSVLRDFVLAAGMAFLVGFFAGVAWIIGYTLIGQEVEDRLRGRTFAFVISSVRVILLIGVALGPPLAGALGGFVMTAGDIRLVFTGPGLTLLIGGVGALAVGAYATRQVGASGRPGLRELVGRAFGRADLLRGKRADTGLFVVVEGTGQEATAEHTRRLTAAVRELGYQVAGTTEPSDSPMGRRIREVLTARPAPDGLAGSDVEPETAALLSAADRAQHVATVVRPALERGEVVICDRYVDTSLAFHGAGRGLELDRILRTSLWGTGGLLPDLTILLDAPRNEQADPTVDPIRKAFLAQAEAAPDRYLVVEATVAPSVESADGGLPPGVLGRVQALLAEHHAQIVSPEPQRPAPSAGAGTPDTAGTPDGTRPAPGTTVRAPR